MTHPALLNDVGRDATPTNAAAQPGLMQRVISWYVTKANAERDAEIGAFIDERGGRLTDEVEREISRRFGGLAG
jgi:hypothetical protein